MADAYICRRGGSGSGGGSELVIVGGTTSPTKADHNTIWLNTPNTITSCVLAATQPTGPVEGMAWINIGASGSVKMVAPVGGEWITVYPLSAKQYVSGKWVDKTAKSYQGGVWVDWWSGNIYVNGVFAVPFNARAVGSGSFANVAAPTVTDKGTHVIIKPTDTGAQNDGIWQSEKIKILKSNTTLQVKFVGGSQVNNWAFYGISKTEPSTGNLNPIAQKTPTNFNTTETLDITDLEGDYYLWFHVGQQSGSAYVYFDISEIRIL